MEWAVSDLASWLAAVAALLAAIFAWRVLHRTSYLEFHPGWSININDDREVIVEGKVTTVSSAAFIRGRGTLRIGGFWIFGGQSVRLLFQRAEPHMLRRNEVNLIFSGTGAKAPKGPSPATLTVRVRLSDGTTKRMKLAVILEEDTPQAEETNTPEQC